jgi:hypothetical protein
LSESHVRGVKVVGKQFRCRRGECPDVGRDSPDQDHAANPSEDNAAASQQLPELPPLEDLARRKGKSKSRRRGKHHSRRRPSHLSPEDLPRTASAVSTTGAETGWCRMRRETGSFYMETINPFFCTQKRTIPTHHRVPDTIRWCSRLAMDVGEGQKRTRCIDSTVQRRGGVE